MLETVAWISIIVGFVAVITISLIAMLITRRREQQAPKTIGYDEAVGKVDEAADAAINEINKTAELVLKDIDEKYQTLLFLYELLEEKLNKASANGAARQSRSPEPAYDSAASSGIPQMPARRAHEFLPPARHTAPSPISPPVSSSAKPAPLNARHERIAALYGEGMSADEIAKELDIGKGEVKLIIDLANSRR